MAILDEMDPNLEDPALGANLPAPAPVLGSATPPIVPPPNGPSPALAAAVAAGRPIKDTSNVSTTTAKLAPEQKQDLKTVDELRAKEAGAIDAETLEHQRVAAAERKAQEDGIRAAEAAQQAKSEAIAQAQQRRAAAEAEYQRKLEEFNGKQFHSFWSTRSKAGEILADIGVTLGAFGSSGRGQNEAADILRSRITDDFNQQRANIENAKDRVVMAKAGVADADEARRILIDDIDVKNAAALAAVKQRLDAAKMPTDALIGAQGEKAKADIAKDLLALRQKTTDSLTQRTTSSTNYLNPQALELKQGAKAAGKDDKSEVFDKAGKLLGFTTSGRGGAQAFMTRDAQTTEAIQKAEELLKNAETGGTNFIDTKRKGLIAGAVGAAATTSPLGKTNEAMDLEAKMMGITHGPLGTSYVNADVLRNRIAQMKETQQNYRTQGLIPPTSEQATTWDARQAASPVAKKEEPGKPAADAPTGEVRTLPDGRKMEKIGTNNWEPI
jgi:hypothetical protein